MTMNSSLKALNNKSEQKVNKKLKKLFLFIQKEITSQLTYT